jgi:hypothetical protein
MYSVYVQYTFLVSLYVFDSKIEGENVLYLSIYAMPTFPNSLECVQTVEILHRITTLKVL